MFLIKERVRIIYGDDIRFYLEPKNPIQNQLEPLAFSFCEMGNNMSDTYAYLDLSPDELSAKGAGGLRQLHHFSLLTSNHTIETPAEDYIPDRIKSTDIQKYESERAKDIKPMIKSV